MKKFLAAFTSLSALILIAVYSIVSFSENAKSYSNADFKNTAEKYLQDEEQSGDPITLRHDGKYFYYVPFLANNSLSSSLPGIMLDSNNQPVTDEVILKELFKYPALVKRFSSNISGFNKLAVSKTAAFAKYCRILEVQKVKAQALNMEGNTVGIIYNGIKLAADATALAKSGIKGIAVLAKDLAKNSVQNAILSYFVPEDSRAILESTQKFFDNSKIAHSSCNLALEAWNQSVSTTGKASPQFAVRATEEVKNMFAGESASISALKQAVERINAYPKIVTKIGKTKYQTGIKDLGKLITQLSNESIYWQKEYENANDENTLDFWIAEQIVRVEQESGSSAPESNAKSSLTGCTQVDLSNDYKLYTYTPENGVCSGYSNQISGSELRLKCTNMSGSWRNFWVKKINVAGLNEIKIKAHLEINDYGADYTGGRPFFEGTCPNGGVKYDNYSNLMVLNADPRPTFDTECNKICSQADWPKCGIAPGSPSIIATCGVPKCNRTQECDLTIDTGSKSELYVVYQTSDPWVAEIEGVMSNLEICPAQML